MSNKVSVIVKIVCMSVVVLLLTGLLVTLIATNTSWGGGFRYPDPGSYEIGDQEYTEAIDSIDVDWITGSIKISAYDGESVKVSEALSENDEKYQLRSKVEDGVLIIKFLKSGVNVNKINFSKELTIEVPRDMANGLRDLTVNSVSSDLTVEDITSDGVRIAQVSGNTELRGDFENIDVETVSGDTEIYAYASCPKHLSIDSVSGEVNIDLPEEYADFDLEADTVSGKVSVKGGDVSRDEDEYVAGRGKNEWEIDTVSGDVRVNIRSAK